jgi:hypothetical protein
MYQRQRGMTFLGVVFILCILGIFALAAVKLTPAYLEYMNIVKALDGLKSKVVGAGPGAITGSLEKSFDISYIKSLSARDIEIKRDGDVFVVRAEYDYVTPFLGNISFSLHFDKSVEVPVQ